MGKRLVEIFGGDFGRDWKIFLADIINKESRVSKKRLLEKLENYGREK